MPELLLFQKTFEISNLKKLLDRLNKPFSAFLENFGILNTSASLKILTEEKKMAESLSIPVIIAESQFLNTLSPLSINESAIEGDILKINKKNFSIKSLEYLSLALIKEPFLTNMSLNKEIKNKKTAFWADLDFKTDRFIFKSEDFDYSNCLKEKSLSSFENFKKLIFFLKKASGAETNIALDLFLANKNIEFIYEDLADYETEARWLRRISNL